MCTITPSLSLEVSLETLDPVHFKFLQAVNLALCGQDDYVGVAPAGSRWKGYARPDSDFDVYLIAGDASVSGDEVIHYEVKKVADRLGISGHAARVTSRLMFTNNLSSRHDVVCYHHVLGDLALPFMGDIRYVEYLRTLAKDRHARALRYDPAFALQELRDTLNSIAFWEYKVRLSWKDSVMSSKITHLESQEKKLLTRYNCDTAGLCRIAIERINSFWIPRLEVILGEDSLKGVNITQAAPA